MLQTYLLEQVGNVSLWMPTIEARAPLSCVGPYDHSLHHGTDEMASGPAAAESPFESSPHIPDTSTATQQ